MRIKPLYIIYVLILVGYLCVGYFNLFSNSFALYFVVGSLIFLFMAMAWELGNFFFEFAEGDEKHMLSYFQDIAAGVAGGFVVAILSEFKGSSLTSVAYWGALPAALAVCMLFLVVLGIPYLDMARLEQGEEPKSALIKEEIKESVL